MSTYGEASPPPPPSFDVVRRVMVFLLGVAVVIDALVADSIGELIVGAVMVGVLPLDAALRALRGRGD